eukprot:355134-Chlamydomonas_euryale.AAC.2
MRTRILPGRTQHHHGTLPALTQPVTPAGHCSQVEALLASSAAASAARHVARTMHTRALT